MKKNNKKNFKSPRERQVSNRKSLLLCYLARSAAAFPLFVGPATQQLSRGFGPYCIPRTETIKLLLHTQTSKKGLVFCSLFARLPFCWRRRRKECKQPQVRPSVFVLRMGAPAASAQTFQARLLKNCARSLEVCDEYTQTGEFFAAAHKQVNTRACGRARK